MASKWKATILFSVIELASVAFIATLLYVFIGDDDEPENQLVSSESSEEKDPETVQEDEDDKNGDEVVETPDSDKGEKPSEEETGQPSGIKLATLGEVSLPARIAPDAIAVALIDSGKILEKGGEQVVDLVLHDIGSKSDRAILSPILRDPSTFGWDSSEPMQVALLGTPNEIKSDDPIVCIAAKLNEAGKLKSFLAKAGDLIKAPEVKNGYEVHFSPNGQGCLVLAEDFFLLLLHSEKEALDDLIAEAERFVHSDGVGSLVETNESFQAFVKESHDAAIWVNGASLAQLPEASDEIPEEFSDLIKGGSGVITLDFENGEAILAGELQVPEGFERFGKGGLSEGAVNLIPAKALAALSLSLDMKAVVDYFENVVLPAAGDPVSLDDTIPELGLKPRDVLETFTGEISVALTEFSMGGGGPVPGEDLPIEAQPEEDPFGGGGDENPPAEVDPFGGSPEPQPVPGQGFPGGAGGGLPPGGPPQGGPGMGGGLPVEFIAALSVDPAKWETLKAAPPLAGAMAGAMLMGISVTVKDDRLLIASKKHIAEAMEGSVQDKLSGSEQSIFKDNDFALKLNAAAVSKLESVPLEDFVNWRGSMKKVSYVAITGKSDEKGSSGALRIGLADKGTNSLKTLVEIGSSLLGVVDPKPMILGVVKSFAQKDYNAFAKFTCLGMEKEAFKDYMTKNPNRKVLRVWDSDRDDFDEDLKNNMKSAFQEILRDAEEEGFQWSEAEVVDYELSDDVKAKLVSGGVELGIHLDDCFLTPFGLLAFDAPKANF